MEINKYRSSFTVAIIDSLQSRCTQVHSTFKKSGYKTGVYSGPDDFFECLEQNPPHILFIHQDDVIEAGEELLVKILSVLPELHLLIFCDPTELMTASRFLQHGVKDCVAMIDENCELLLASADRAAERDYYMYLNEQIKERDVVVQSPGFEGEVSFSLFSRWEKELIDRRNLKEVIDLFLEEVSRYTNNSEVIFFKYIPSHQSLVATQSVVQDVAKVRGLGIDLKEENKGYILDQLLNPSSLGGLKKLLKGALEIEKYCCFPLTVQGIPEGIFVIHNANNYSNDSYILACLNTLMLKVLSINLAKKLHSSSINDEKTKVLNRSNFLEALKKEVSRSRRISMPVSLLIISLDHFEDYEKELNNYEVDVMLKMSATVLKRHSRVNDIVGRIDQNEFGIILPHTGKLGAAIKAERLRRIFESADFSKVIPSSRQLTLSVGISEYPSHCRDYEDILSSADEALSEVRNTGFNKACMAAAPANFVPDFILDGTKL